MFSGENPLWLPEGSVRSLLALVLTGAFVYVIITGGEVATELAAAAGTAWGFYFGARTASNGG